MDKALGKLGIPALDARFAEMTINLMPHQVLGVSWMLEKEKDKKFRGGLLCDAMGESSSGGASEVDGLTPCRSWQGPCSSSVYSDWNYWLTPHRLSRPSLPSSATCRRTAKSAQP